MNNNARLGENIKAVMPYGREARPLAGAVTITRYGRRNWAVYCDGALLCVTLYLRGALAVADKLSSELTPFFGNN